MTPHRWLERSPLHIAHQGGEAEAPSSTLFAMATAVTKGADALELDVHATADGHLVVLHDPTVDRTTEGSGAVDALSLAQVQDLDAAHWFVAGEGVVHGEPPGRYPFRGVATGQIPPPAGFAAADFTIPALVEVFERFPDTLINIDIKQTAPATRPYEPTLARLIADYDRSETTMVASFLDAALAAFRVAAPSVATSASPDEVLAFWLEVQAGEPAPDALPYEAFQVPVTHDGVRVVDAAFVERAHAAGLAVHVWTIDDAPTMHALLDLGVDGLVTNRPQVLEPVLAERVPHRRRGGD